MTLDLEALEARLTEYDPDAPGYATLSELLADRLPIDPEGTPCP